MDLAGWLVDPFASGFMQRAAVAAIIVGGTVPLVGTWILLRRLSYLGDAMSHATLAGIALAFIFGLSITGGALLGGIAMALLIALLDRHPRLRQDAVIGIGESVLFAIGIIVINGSGRIGVDLSHFLLGQITTVSTADLWLDLALAAIAVAALWYLFPDLLAATFDAEHALQVGVPVGRLQVALLVLLSVAIVVSLQTVGLLLSVALLVIPASTARLLTDRVAPMSLIAVGIGVTSSLAGLVIAYHAATPAGATIALLAAAILGVVAIATVPRRARPAIVVRASGA
jgi:ABC-type Mn2+/Zn2+ transport system permease subunit